MSDGILQNPGVNPVGWRQIKLKDNGDGTASVYVIGAFHTSGVTTSITASTSPVSLLASDPTRAGATITNTSQAALFVLLGAGTVSSTNYTVSLANGSYFETPFGFVGAISGIWANAAPGAALVTVIS